MILQAFSTLFHYNTQIFEFCGTGVIMIVMNYLLFLFSFDDFVFCFVVFVFGVGGCWGGQGLQIIFSIKSLH